MEIPQHIKSIIQQQIAGETVTEHDRQVVDDWYSNISVEEHFTGQDWNDIFTFLKIDRESDNRMSALKAFMRDADFKDQSTFVSPEITPESSHAFIPPAHRIHFIRKFWWAAAILILAVGVTTAILVSSDRQSKLPDTTDFANVTQGIAPGSNKAILTLADGRTIALDSVANGQIANQGNVNVTKLANGEIRYNLKDANQGEVMMNTMYTPRGGQYMLVLPDGSKVWLNAASSITYPAAFVGMERKVRITGEVYMDVAKDKSRPFTVDIDGKSSIKVLGTSFNINAYNDESAIKTTLIEGSVKVNNDAILKPGQQAIITGVIQQPKIVDANIAQTVAWKNGLFDFSGLTVRSAINQLSRWYDVDVRFENEPNFKLMGKMYRNAKFSEVLDILKEMDVKFRFEGKTLIVL